MNKTQIQICLITIFVLFSLTPAYSQTTYSLYELTKLANIQSETIKIAKDDLYINRQDKARALSVLMPRATSYASIMEYKDESASAPDTTTFGAKLTQSFTLNGKELIAYDVTKKLIKGKEFSLETTRSQYLLQVSKAYYNILSAQRFLEIAQSDVKRLTTYKNSVNEKLNVGNVTKTDLYRAQAELSKSLTDQVIGENRVLQAKAALQNLVRIDDDFDLIKEDIPEIRDYQSSLDDIQTYALKNRTEIKEAKTNVEVAKQTIKFEKSDYWPTVALEAGYRNTDIEYAISSTTVNYDTEERYLQGELVFTLFDGGLRKAEIRQAIAEYRKAQNALKLTEKQVILDSKVSYLDYESAKKVLLNLQDELKSAQETFNAVQMQFQYGMADSLNIMDANTLLVSAQRRILNAKYEYFISVINILYTRGDLNSFLLNPA